MKESLISVLVTNYNHRDTIKETIDSVLNQTHQNIQFIIVDDGSTDDSCELIEAYEDERIELYRLQDNQHICVATNYGLSKIEGEYLARIDSDDVWYPQKLERQLQYFNEHPDCKICFTWCDYIDEYGNNINEQERDRLHLHDTAFESQAESLERFYFRGNCLVHSSVLMKTTMVREIGGFRLGYKQLHDFDYWIRISKHHKLDVITERYMAVRRFCGEDKKQINASNMGDETETKVFNEYMELRAHFFDDITDELFIKAFGKHFIGKHTLNEQELECEKAFLLCKPHDGWDGVPPAGISRLQELFENIHTREVLEQKYCFAVKELYKLSEQHIYCDSLIKKQQNLMKEQIEELNSNCRFLEEQVAQYAESTSWRITKPLRWIKGLFEGEQGK